MVFNGDGASLLSHFPNETALRGHILCACVREQGVGGRCSLHVHMCAMNVKRKQIVLNHYGIK